MSGVEGVKKIYDDILLTNEDFLLIRPVFENVFNTQISPITSEFIDKRLRKGLKVTAITPTDQTEEVAKNDSTFLFQRTWVPIDMYNSPVEINIYGNKIAFLSYAKELIGVIIESPQITHSMRQIFELMRLGSVSAENIVNTEINNNKD